MSSNNEDEIYRKLQRYLNSLPIDYPETESGVELRILKQLFTPQEAEIALKLKIIPQEPKAMFRPFKKKGWTIEQFSETLLTMAKKGSINWIRRRDGTNYYSIAFLMVGFYDYQIDMVTKQFADDFDQYMDEGFVSAMLENGILQMRTIPIEKSVSLEYNVSNFDEIKTIIDNIDKTLYLCPCICRQSKEVQGKGCDHPKETCISIGANPRIFLEQGREVTKDEALEVLRMAQDRGMVISPSNTQKPFIICCCCGCSCVVLSNLKKYANPAQYIKSFVDKIPLDEQAKVLYDFGKKIAHVKITNVQLGTSVDVKEYEDSNLELGAQLMKMATELPNCPNKVYEILPHLFRVKKKWNEVIEVYEKAFKSNNSELK